MKLLILGMDNTGKTTLAKELSTALNIKVVNSLGPNATKEEMENFILENVMSPEDLIFERFSFFEEMVYGKILRDGSKFSFKSPIFKNILNSDVEIIYCRPDKGTIKNWKCREQMPGVIDESDKLIKRYDKIIRKVKKHGIKVIKYNYTKENALNVISQL